MNRRAVHYVTSLLAAALAIGMLAGRASAAPPQTDYAVVSNSPTATETSKDLRSDTPRIFFRTSLPPVPAGAALRTVWTAVNAKGAPPNLTLDATSVAAVAGLTQFDTSLPRPAEGWPSGDYRVDLYLNDTLQSSVAFKISPN
jgi:hypothetical protein